MIQSIPRDPVQLMAARIAIGLLALLAVLALLPHQAQTAPVQAEAPRIIVVTATPHAGPEPPAPQHVEVVQEAAPTAVPVAAMPVAPPAAEPPSQLVHNADGSVSLPGSEAWMAPQPAVTNADPALQIERDAAAAYQQLPVAQPPSAENEQPVMVRRPHTGR
jgi:hypothetical protein